MAPRAPRLAPRRVLLIGWDGADWKLLNRLLDAGMLPTVQRLVERGVMGNLASLEPMYSPLVWTSIATGKRGHQHGICWFTEPQPDRSGVRIASSTSRRCKAIWNILTQVGLRAHTIGWFASHPAEPVSGVAVSNLYPRCRTDRLEQDPVPTDAVHPPELAATLARLRVSPFEIDGPSLRLFVPRALEVDQSLDSRLATVARLIAESANAHVATTWVLENEPWDFVATYYDGIDHFSHGFMRYHPPRLDGVDERDFETYREVVTAGYRLHDLMLQRLLDLAGDDATVIIVSDHGFHSDHLRPPGFADGPAGNTTWHERQGICLVSGPGIRQDEILFGASALDVTPTILMLLGLPVGEDMGGKPLAQILDPAAGPVSIERIPSWESIPGECGMHPPERREDPFDSMLLVKHMEDLGYVDPPGEELGAALDGVHTEYRLALARDYFASRKPADAISVLEQLRSAGHVEPRFTLRLARAYQASGQPEKARPLLEEALERDPRSPAARLLFGTLEASAGNDAAAHEHLLAAERGGLPGADLQVQIGRLYLRLRRWADAQAAFERAIAVDAQSVAAHDGHAAARLRQGDPEQAALSALRAIGLRHDHPLAHHRLGLALVRLRDLERAVEAFEVALSYSPGFAAPRRWLCRLLPLVGRAPEVVHHRRLLEGARRPRRQAGSPPA